MKKLLISLFIAVLSLPAVNAQFTKIGGGLGYGTGFWFHEMEYDYNRSGHFPIFMEYSSEPRSPSPATRRRPVICSEHRPPVTKMM